MGTLPPLTGGRLCRCRSDDVYGEKQVDHIGDLGISQRLAPGAATARDIGSESRAEGEQPVTWCDKAILDLIVGQVDLAGLLATSLLDRNSHH